ncbi:tetratricopeptide repeat protein [Desulfovibrio sp. OttesenSCG-928-A18]|nr:tetratricopeptide repeat protein [Desulfovibrio sp. OttesenSCG-928-A18]
MKKLLLFPVFIFLVIACTPMEEKRDAFMNTAQELEKTRSYAAARVEANKVLELDPAYTRAYILLGRMDYAEKNWQGAGRNFSKALDLLGGASGGAGDPMLLEVLEYLCRVYIATNDIPKAEDYAERAAALNSSSPQVAVLRAGIMMRGKNFVAAIPLLEAAMAAQPDYEEAILGLASAYINTDNMPKAKELLAAKLAVLPDSAAIRNLLLNLAVRDKDYAAAEEHLRYLTAKHPDAESLIIQLADIYMASGKRQEVPELLTGFLEKHPDAEKIRLRLAENYIGLEQHDKAMQLLEAAPQPTTNLKLSRAGILYQLGRLADAEALLREVINDPAAGQAVIAAKYNLADVYLQQRRLRDAETLLTDMMRLYPDERRAQFLRGRLRAAEGRFPEAIRDIEAVVKLAPNDLPAALSLVDVYNAAGLTVMAESTVKEIIEKQPAFLEAHMVLVTLHMEHGKNEEALAALEAARKAIPENLDLIVAQADVLTHLKRYDDAVKVLEEIVKIKEYSELALFRIAGVYAEAERHMKAVATFDRILELNPASSMAAEGRLRAQVAAKQADKALAFAEKRQAQRPDDPVAAMLTGEAALLAKNVAKAEKAFLRSLEINPAGEQPLTRLVQLYTATKRPEEAMKLCRRIAEKAPDSPGAYILLGIMHEQKNELGKAEEIYREILKKHPDQLVAANNLAQLLSSYKSSESRLEEAEALARKAIASKEPATMDTLGWILHLRGKNEEAQNYLGRAYQQLPGNASVAFRLATVFAAQDDEGKKREAVSILQKITGKDVKFAEKKEAQKLLDALRKKK